MRTNILAAATLVLPLLASAASVDGAKIHYTAYGNGPKTVLFVHGWTCDETSWSAQVPVFEKNYRVITIDLPGHGNSEFPTNETLSMSVFARAVEAVRAEANADKIVLVGHSMGAPVIWEYALRYPQHVVGIVPVDGLLIAPTGGPASADVVKGEQGYKLRETMVASMIATASPEIQQHVKTMMLTNASERTAAEAFGAMYGPKQAGGPLDFQGLGIYAGKRTGTLAPQLPNSKVVGIEGTGHFVMLEKAAEFNKLLSDFLAGVKF